MLVKSHIQAESHSHIADIVNNKRAFVLFCLLFVRVVHAFSLKTKHRSPRFVIMDRGPSSPSLCTSPNSRIAVLRFACCLLGSCFITSSDVLFLDLSILGIMYGPFSLERDDLFGSRICEEVR